MAISLKNIDDRLKVLEDKLTGSVIGFPDWSKITKIKDRGGRTYEYISTDSSWLLIYLEYSGRHNCYLNDVRIASCVSESSRWEDHNTFLLPVNKGDKIKLEETYYSNSGWIWKIPVKL